MTRSIFSWAFGRGLFVLGTTAVLVAATLIVYSPSTAQEDDAEDFPPPTLTINAGDIGYGYWEIYGMVSHESGDLEGMRVDIGGLVTLTLYTEFDGSYYDSLAMNPQPGDAINGVATDHWGKKSKVMLNSF